MTEERRELLKKIQELEFACIDFNLYLDTHPWDQRALAEYNAYANQLAIVKRKYESMYGPLSNFGQALSQYPWRWIESPWPWEIED